MKVRWTKNSFRLRITPRELDALEQGDPVREEIRIPGSALPGWTVVLQTGSFGTSLQQLGCSVLFLLGNADLSRLSSPKAEGVYFEVDPTDISRPGTGNRGVFRYYIEKDFPCIHPRAGDAMEEPTETFETPAHFAERK
ncbi:MAG: hypothetical protein V4671_16105 [Armatimonadota bacterium]